MCCPIVCNCIPAVPIGCVTSSFVKHFQFRNSTHIQKQARKTVHIHAGIHTSKYMFFHQVRGKAQHGTLFLGAVCCHKNLANVVLHLDVSHMCHTHLMQAACVPCALHQMPHILYNDTTDAMSSSPVFLTWCIFCMYNIWGSSA